jgi:hypothetical protein
MNKPIGGRGKKAPYNTVVMRIPEPLVEKVEKLVDWYRIAALEGIVTQDDLRRIEPWKSEYSCLGKSVAILKAKEILKRKQSAKQSLLKLLQVLYDSEISEKDIAN